MKFDNNNDLLYNSFMFNKITKYDYLNFNFCSKKVILNNSEKKKIINHKKEMLSVVKKHPMIGKSKIIDLKQHKKQKIQESSKHISNNHYKFLFNLVFSFDYQNKKIETSIDLLEKNFDGSFNLFLIKNSTNINQKYYEEIAYQKWVFENATNKKVNNVFLVFLDKTYIRGKRNNFEKMISIQELNSQIIKSESEIVSNLNKYFNYGLKDLRNVKLGSRCKKCSFQNNCWEQISKDNVLNLFSVSDNTVETLYKEKIQNINQLPNNYKIDSYKHEIQFLASQNNPYINYDKISFFNAKIMEDIVFLDFETKMINIPFLEKMSPNELLPVSASIFQNDKIFNWNNLEKKDKREELVFFLIKQLKKVSQVGVFNSVFEKRIINLLVKWYPEYKEDLFNISKKIIDISIPFKNMYYYNHDQKGKTDLKTLAKVILQKNIIERDNALTNLDQVYAKKYQSKEYNQKVKEFIQYNNQDVELLHELVLYIKNIQIDNQKVA